MLDSLLGLDARVVTVVLDSSMIRNATRKLRTMAGVVLDSRLDSGLSRIMSTTLHLRTARSLDNTLDVRSMRIVRGTLVYSTSRMAIAVVVVRWPGHLV